MRRNIERVSELADIEQRDIVFAALRAADIAAIKLRFMSQCFLRQPSLLSQLAQTISEGNARVFSFHERQNEILRVLIPQDITTI